MHTKKIKKKKTKIPRLYDLSMKVCMPDWIKSFITGVIANYSSTNTEDLHDLIRKDNYDWEIEMKVEKLGILNIIIEKSDRIDFLALPKNQKWLEEFVFTISEERRIVQQRKKEGKSYQRFFTL